jgi:hypothetical protein
MSAGSNYSELLRTAFDLHRFSLYQALHLPLPTFPDSEVLQGKALSLYLKRGEKLNIPFYPETDLALNHEIDMAYQ